LEAASWGTTTSSSTISPAPTKAATAAETSTASEATTATKAAATAETAAETTTTESSWAGTGKTIFTNLKLAALPVVAIKLLDSVSSIIRRLKSDDARPLRSTIRSDVHIGAKN
jgi:hypothetical protein